MNYLTQYYKNYYLKLQEQVNYLSRQLNEAAGRDPMPFNSRHLNMYGETIGSAIVNNWFGRLERYLRQNPADIRDLLRSESPQFREYVLHNYGQVIFRDGSYQRLLPDGRIQHWSTTGNWIDIDKPGSNTFFGPIGGNGRHLPPEIFGPGIPGHSPSDVSYSPYINPFGSRPRNNGMGDVIGGGGANQQIAGPGY